jgi:hypothetical protein
MQATMLYGAARHPLEDRPPPPRLSNRPMPLCAFPPPALAARILAVRGIQQITESMPMGNEYRGVVEEGGSEVRHSGHS